jgi:hypothetical protein
VTITVAAAVLMTTMGAAGGCAPKSSSPNAAPTASPSPKFTEPKGAVAPPPQHGSGTDPRDDDFFNSASPPKDAPAGVVTYEVRAQLYNAQAESIGGIATAFINATALDPRAVGGVGGSQPGVFPYDRESVRLPFQFPIFLQPGIVVSVGATFSAFVDKGEILSCWLMAPNLGEIPGTRTDVHAVADHSLISVSCFGNIG